MAIQTTTPTAAIIQSIHQALPTHWKRADGSQKRRLVMSVEGLTGTGKTEFALTAPGPIAFFKFDLNCDSTLAKWAGQKEIYEIACRVPDPDIGKADVQKEAEAIVKQFTADYVVALANRAIRTVVWDTTSELYEVMSLATFGKISGNNKYSYGALYRAFHRLVDAATESDTNLVMIHHLKDEYVNDQRTGKKRRDGYKKVDEACQLMVRTEFTGNQFSLEVLKCTQNMALQGQIYKQAGELRMNSFPVLATDVFNGSSLEDWQ